MLKLKFNSNFYSDLKKLYKNPIKKLQSIPNSLERLDQLCEDNIDKLNRIVNERYKIDKDDDKKDS